MLGFDFLPLIKIHTASHKKIEHCTAKHLSKRANLVKLQLMFCADFS